MTIQEILEHALEEGIFTSAMELEVTRLCQATAKLSFDEYAALDQLMAALLAGDVAAAPSKQFINVMEELVIERAIARAAEIETTSHQKLDIGDIAAFALNRLPPLYATTKEGANYQRQRAATELQSLIHQQVEEAIHRYLNHPAKQGEPIQLQDLSRVMERVSLLLRSIATN